MSAATWQFQLHILLGFALFMLIPFTRLVHAFSAPIHYLFRPYIVYRSRDRRSAPQTASTTKHAAGWAPIGTKDRDARR